MTTNNGLDIGLAGATGSGNVVGSTSPTITTPRVITAINDSNGNGLFSLVATASAVNFFQFVNNITGNAPTIVATGSDSNINLRLNGKGTGYVQITGVNTNSDAVSGSVGEYISSTVLIGSAVALTAGAPVDITTISLGAGDWDVWGTVVTNPAGATTTTNINGWISTSSATVPTPPNNGAMYGINLSIAAGLSQQHPVGTLRLLLASTTTVYLSMEAVFGGSTMSGYGFIGARRRR